MDYCDCGRQASAICTGCRERVCPQHKRSKPSFPEDVQRRDVELPQKRFDAVPEGGVLCDACLDQVLDSWVGDVAQEIRRRSLSEEAAAMELLTHWGWHEPYTGRRREAAIGSRALAAAFGEAPSWAFPDLVGTAAMLYARFMTRSGRGAPKRTLAIWDQTPANTVLTASCRLWELKSWDSDSGDRFLWVGEAGGWAAAPVSFSRGTIHIGDWDRTRAAINAASADPLDGPGGSDLGFPGFDCRSQGLLKETASAFAVVRP